jgi:hypothetical protein
MLLPAHLRDILRLRLNPENRSANVYHHEILHIKKFLYYAQIFVLLRSNKNLHPPIVVLWPASLAVNETTARSYKLAIGLSELDPKCLHSVCLFRSPCNYCH